MILNKKDFIARPKIYTLLTKLEESIEEKNELSISIVVTQLKQLGFYFKVESEDQQLLPLPCSENRLN